MGRPRSLVLITVDCLRADHVGFGGYSRPTTPFLDALAEDSLVFTNAVVGGAPTYYSFPAIMASRYPLAFGRDVIGLAPGEPTLATILQERGYVTAAFLAGNPYLSSQFGYHQGFDVFHDYLDATSDSVPDKSGSRSRDSLRSRLNRGLEKASRELGPLGALYDELYFEYCQRKAPPVTSLDVLRRFPAADVLVDRACSWLATVGDSSFFLWIHFMDPHSPYYPSQPAADLMGITINASRARYLNSFWNRGDLSTRRLANYHEEVMGLYDAGIRWVDAQVSRLVESLRKYKRWDNCVFALTGDHGEEFLDHGGRYHPPSKVMEELIHVPLLLHVPDRLRGTVKSAFSLIDFAPTALQVLTASVADSFQGQSRWQHLQGGEEWDDAAIVECVSGCTNPFRSKDRLGARIMGVRESRYKLVLDFDSSSEQLFDLEADPRELRPLPAAIEPLVRRRLLERARQHIASSLQSRDVSQRLTARLHGLRQQWARPESGMSA